MSSKQTQHDTRLAIVRHKMYTINTDSFNNTTLPIQTQINVYTDGSNTDTHTGSGYSIMRGNDIIDEGSRRLPGESTVFQAEIMAKQMAMNSLANSINVNDRFIKIFSDSQAAIQALNSTYLTSKLVKNTINALNQVGNKVESLEINWIKAHVGHPGNERADALARNSVTLQQKNEGISPPYSYFNSQLSDITYKLWTNEWQTHPTCRLSKNFLLYQNKNKSKTIFKLSRSQMRRLLELVTGQNNLNYIQSKIFPSIISELCRFCEEEE